MTKTLIGSAAIKHYFPDFREPKDIDYFSPHPIDGAETFWHRDLSLWTFEDIATLDELYTIKVSHSYWELHGTWLKHAQDMMYLKQKGAKLIPELHKILYKIWEQEHGKKKANLETDPEDFFNDRIVKRIYDHDSLHESVAYGERPLFEKILRDDSAVAVDKSKWDALPEEDKLNMVREEVYATALERKLIPNDYTGSPRAAYAWTLRKTVTSLTKGWFALYVADNLEKVWKPDVNYVQRHKDNADRLRPYENSAKMKTTV